MLYEINLHKHVRICLHKSSTEFISKHRALTLIQLRQTNPQDKICLVYDSSLITGPDKHKIINDLTIFCLNHSLDAFDVRSDLNMDYLYDDEKELFAIYEQEISTLEHGGSLNAATQYLRLFNAILEKGTISSDSSYIDTSNLPPRILIESPCLYNIKTSGTLEEVDKRFMQIDTDLLAVCDIKSATRDLSKLRSSIVSANTYQQTHNFYGAKNTFMAAFQSVKESFESTLERYVPTRQLNLFPQIALLHNIATSIGNVTPIEARHKLITESKDIEGFAKAFLFELIPDQIIYLTNDELIEKAAFYINQSIATEEKILELNNETDDCVSVVRSFIKLNLECNLDLIDSYVSGGALTTLAIYPQLFATSNLEEEPIMRSSFSRYGLDKDFISEYYHYQNGRKASIKPSPNNELYRQIDDYITIDTNSMIDKFAVTNQLSLILDKKDTDDDGFILDPHRHVKIWLSSDKNIFMNLENQLRLIKLRKSNPDDRITLVFDSQILTREAVSAAIIFCEKYVINLLDVQSYANISLGYGWEGDLLKIYLDEITHINQGGNLGAASDILRWLPFVYSQGIYTDMDVHIDTSNMPDIIKVRAPILLNFSPVFLANDREDCVSLDFNGMSNDIIAIVDEEAAHKQISHMQYTILKSYRKPIYYSGYDGGYDELPEEFQNKLYPLRELLRSESKQLSVPECRNYIMQSPILKGEAIDLLRIITCCSSGPMRRGIFDAEKYTTFDLYNNIQWLSIHKYKSFLRAFEIQHDLSWTPVGLQLSNVREAVIIAICPTICDKLQTIEQLERDFASNILKDANNFTTQVLDFLKLLSQEITVLDKMSESWVTKIGIFGPKKGCRQTRAVILSIINDFENSQIKPQNWYQQLKTTSFSTQQAGIEIKNSVAGLSTNLEKIQGNLPVSSLSGP